MRSYLVLALALVLSACGAPFTPDPLQVSGDDAGPPDAAPDTRQDAPGPPDAADGAAPDASPLDGQPDAVHAPDAPPDAPQPPQDSGADGGCTLVTHDDGFGGHWTDCNPLGTYTFASALTACATHTGGAQYCAGLAQQAYMPVCSNQGGYPTCDCWQYNGAQVGYSVGYVNDGLCGCNQVVLGNNCGKDAMWQ
jgi:hypothetical protein